VSRHGNHVRVHLLPPALEGTHGIEAVERTLLVTVEGVVVEFGGPRVEGGGVTVPVVDVGFECFDDVADTGVGQLTTEELVALAAVHGCVGLSIGEDGRGGVTLLEEVERCVLVEAGGAPCVGVVGVADYVGGTGHGGEHSLQGQRCARRPRRVERCDCMMMEGEYRVRNSIASRRWRS